MSALDHQPQGSEGFLGLGIESVFGTAVAATQWVPGRSTIKRNPGLEVADLAIGEYDERIFTRRPFKASGGLSLELCPGRCAEIIDLFEMLSSPNLNTATVYEQHAADFIKKHTSVAIASGTFRCESGGDLMLDADCRAQNSGAGVAQTPNFTSLPAPFTFEELAFTVDSGAVDYLTGIEIAIDQVVRDDKYGSDGTYLVRGFPSRRRRIVVRPTFDFEDDAWYGYADDETEIELNFLWTRSTLTFEINFPRCIVTIADPDQPEIESETVLTPEIIPLLEYGGSRMTMVEGGV